MSNVRSRQEWLFNKINNELDRDKLREDYVLYQLIKTQQIFEYKGLPDTIAKRDLELYLQVNGFAIIKEVEGQLYAFFGGLGGIPNAYYLPTKAIVTNPYLRYNAELEIDKDCVVINNDILRKGLIDLFNKYATLLADADISLQMALVNVRIPYIITANDDNTMDSAKHFIDDIKQGKMGIVGTGVMIEEISKNLETNQFAVDGSNTLKQILETRQNIMSMLWNDLGLNADSNLKRTYVNELEASMGDSILFPLVDEMLEQRRIGLEKVNKMYGTNITVEYSSAWRETFDNKKREEDKQDAEIEEIEARAESQDQEDQNQDQEEKGDNTNEEEIKGND